MLPVTFVILTHNEERNIAACIESISPFSDDIHVIDSGSQDKTLSIATDLKIPTYFNPFSGFGDQRNWATKHIRSKHNWHFHLDADERFTQPLAQEIQTILEDNPSEAGFFVSNRLMIGKHWLKYSSGYPVYQVRLFNKDRLRFENYGHGQREVTEGSIGTLREPYDHFGFSKGIEDWFQKHIHYAWLESETACSHSSSLVVTLRDSVFGSKTVRRRALKQLTFLLPGRPYLRMLYLLVFKFGILDGRAGISYAKMIATYDSMTHQMIRWKRLDQHDG